MSALRDKKDDGRGWCCRFFSETVDVLGTCSKDGRVIVWRIEQSSNEELSSVQLLSLVLQDGGGANSPTFSESQGTQLMPIANVVSKH